MGLLDIDHKRLPTFILIVALVLLFGTLAASRTATWQDWYYWLALGLMLTLVVTLTILLWISTTHGRQRPEETTDAGQDLDEQSLREAVHKSDKLNTIGALASGLAHDWNNLLLVLSMEASRLRDNSQPDSWLLDCVKTLEQVVDEGRRTTDKLLGLAQHDHEPLVPANLHAEVHEATRSLARVLPGNVSLETTDILNDGLIVESRISHLHQIVMNLGLNARDAIGQKNGTITMSISGPEQGQLDGRPGLVARLVVKDDGQGMPQEVVDRVFELLFTAGQDRGGMGLGLVVVKKFVMEMSGHIAVESIIDGGTTVTVTLPILPPTD